MAWRRIAMKGVAGTPFRVDTALLWFPTLALASVGWAVFHDYGWIGWLALLAGGYLGRAVGDLVVGGGRPGDDAAEPRRPLR